MSIKGGKPNDRRVVPNLVVVGVGAGGNVSIYNHSGSAHLAVDIAGYFLEEPGPVRWVEPGDLSQERPGERQREQRQRGGAE